MVAAAQKGDLEAMQFLLSIGVSPGGADSAHALRGGARPM